METNSDHSLATGNRVINKFQVKTLADAVKSSCTLTGYQVVITLQSDALTANPPTPAHKDVFGHPAGLVTLFFTELWERFSYYGMRALLMLYMVAPLAAGGLAFNVRDAATIYGVYTMAVYMSSMLGGFIADRFWGCRKTVLIGGLIISLGHFTLAVPALSFFYLGLLLIVFGTGMLKPNISSMVGKLYAPGDNRRDAGFSIFYMGINIGAAIAPVVCGFFAQHPAFKTWLVSVGLPAESGWHFGFGVAGVGMLIGLAHLVWQRKLLDGVGDKPNVAEDAHAKATGADGARADAPLLESQEFKHLLAIACLFFFNVLFWAVYEQGGSSLSLFADKLTRNELFGFAFPSSWFQSVPALFVVLLAPLISALWLKLGDRQPSSPAKFALGLLFLGAGIGLAAPASLLAVSGKVSPLWLVGVFFLQVVGELCLSPVGLSTVTKLAPARFLGITMGVWFISMALGNFLAGYLAGFFEEGNVNALVNLFGGMAAVCVLASGVLFVALPKIRGLMKGAL